MDSDYETDSDGDETTTVTTFPAPGLCRPDSNRSLHYFFDDGSIFIRLSDSIIVYCVWGSQLLQQSSFFRDLASLPIPAPGTQQASAGDGKSEASPLALQHTEAQFEVFLECVLARFGEKSRKHRPTIFWMMALEMADFFQAPKITKLAKKWLSRRKDLDPAVGLHLAMQYRVAEWVEPSFRALIHTPLASLSDTEIKLIGFSPYVILAETQAKITQHRALCAVLAPPVSHHSSCDEPTTCSLAWAHAWWGEAAKQGIAIALIHPAQIPARRILSTLPDLGTSWQMSAACKRLTAKYLKDEPSVLLREEIFIAKAIAELKKF
ncbi:hypothetical protein B0H13DRAFT_2309535 [Mycena leptocephala]|nr:hypothetical protein B0H13DRAFT_2309535 [Mycena leptocephala]